jgi:phage N-6-adenine-methyltransferase
MVNYEQPFDGRDYLTKNQAPTDDGVVLIRAADITPEHVEYLDDNLIPLRVVTLAVGLDGVGKSTALYTKAARATRGTLPGAFTDKPVDVVIASSEDHPGSVIVPRLIAAGADLERVHVVKVRRDGITGDITLPDDLDDLADRVVNVAAKMLIVDPLVAHLPMSIDSYKAQHIRRVLAPLAHMAEEQHLAVVAAVHFNGGPSSDVRSRISGSKAIRDASRSVLVFGPDPEDESRFVMVQDKHSFGPKATTGRTYRIEPTEVVHQGERYPTSVIQWGDTVNLTATDLLRTGDAEERSERDNAKEFLLEFLGDGPMLSADVKVAAKTEGITPKVLRSAREDLKVEIGRNVIPGKKGRGPSLWSLPNTCPPNTSPSTGHVLADTETVAAQGLRGDLDQADLIDAHCPTGGTYSELPHVARTSGNNEWYTPAEYVDAARRVMGGIDLDPASCATANDVVQAASYYTAENDGLTMPWAGRVWLNPPYSKALVDRFVARLVDAFCRGDVTEAIVLTNNATETQWFHRLAAEAAAVCTLKGRVKFWTADGVRNSPLQGQAVLYLGRNLEAFRREFGHLGQVLTTARCSDEPYTDLDRAVPQLVSVLDAEIVVEP